MDEIRKWLEQNKAHFTNYSDQEIADVAVACGFDKQMVAQALTHRKFEAA